jgi:kinesin family protein C1
MIDRATKVLEVMESKIASLTQELAETKAKLSVSEDKNRKLRKRMFKTTGNVLVFARVKPASDNESPADLSIVDASSLKISSSEPTTAGVKPKNCEFKFDHVFGPDTRQEEVFETVSPLIESALDGFNVCLFAYGKR